MIRVGDVFEDNDPRMMRYPIFGAGWKEGARKRRFEVAATGEDRVVVKDTVTGLHTQIRRDRLEKGGRRGYTKVEPAS